MGMNSAYKWRRYKGLRFALTHVTYFRLGEIYEKRNTPRIS